MKRKEKGRVGERIAKRYLQSKGYKILRTNFKGKFGEIDIICEKEGILIFVEVRTKSKDSFISPEESMDRRKIMHIKKAAYEFLNSFKRSFKGVRFDFIGVILEKGKVGINHIENITG